ncbi:MULTISPECIES: malectin domain-containing carbohydrate-binding protein [unclassified Arenibacter]|uniref:malectin domain-containing carbohydrate-binding protein n=1 Tax=unclassified Arenibacter TaxID=2615047 RepID=UPI0020434C27|nr:MULTISPECIES: malectin domain-containing carbohydrate-binding protein [unclassified Arenibacter]
MENLKFNQTIISAIMEYFRKMIIKGISVEGRLLPLLTFMLLILFCHNHINAQSFSQSNLNYNGNGGVSQGTSLMYGPDGRLYVLNLNGTIDIFTVQKNASNNYVVTAAESLAAVKNIPNHNDDGSSNSGNNREATGLTVAGTALNPIIYVTSSDSRVGGPSGDLNLDTNSGVITRLTWTGSSWSVVDIVRGLPRSEENHATNGLEFVTINGVDFLIVASGGHTNAGSPSDNFAWTTEYALSAAVLSINLDLIENMPIKNDGRDYIYDIPTLDDPTRSNVNGIEDPAVQGYNGIDVNDPWGGNDGLNQAKIVIGGPVQIFSPGYRNAYDLVLTATGAVYVTDNGANGGWGGFPNNEGTANVTNDYNSSEPGSNSNSGGESVDNDDHLSLITNNIQAYSFGTFYGGHPAPIRANPTGAGLYTNPSVNNTSGAVFRTLIYDPTGTKGVGYTNQKSIALPVDWPPVPVSLANEAEGDWRGPSTPNPDGDQDAVVTVWGNNTNGIDEYTSTIFTGPESMVGDLIAGQNDGILRRVELNADGSLEELTSTFASGLGGNALGITCNGDNDPFPGTIWVATFNGTIKILEPQPVFECYEPTDPLYVGSEDTDQDGYTNQDEVQNGIDHCNGGAQPNDFDKLAGGVLVSNLNDNDDDNDGILDANDPFQMGNPLNNGSDGFDLPVINELLSDNLVLGGYLGLGLTGLMNNGAPNPNWLNWLDVVGEGPNPNDILGGATGAMTMQMTSGSASGSANNQEKGFQYGVNVDQSVGSFMVEGRLFNFSDPTQLYGNLAPANSELGIFIGDGTQSNFIKVVLTKNGIVAIQEINDIPQTQTQLTAIIDAGNRPANDVVFSFNVNTVSAEVQILYSIDGNTPISLGTIASTGTIKTAIQQSSTILAVGLIGTSNAAGQEVEGTWDYLNVTGSQPTVSQPLANLEKLIDSPNQNIDLNDYFGDDQGVGNLTYTVSDNTNPAIGANIAGNILTLDYPDSEASSTITIRATDSNLLFVEQIFTVNVTEQPAVLFRVNAGGATIAATDSPNPDWAANDVAGASGGTNFTVNTGNTTAHNITGRHSSVPTYAPQAIFAQERWDAEELPEMEWAFNTGNGTFTVNLYMGNGYEGTGSPGQRVFDVNLEGALVINDKDLSGQYGNMVGAMESYQVTVNDGVLNIEFIHQTENPLINAIEILGAGSVANIPISIDPVANQINNPGDTPTLNITASGGDPNENFTFTVTGLPPGLSIEPTQGAILGTISSYAEDAGQYNVTVTVSKPSSTPANVNFAWTVNNPNVPNTVLYRINAGGNVVASNDASPLNWEEDQAASGANGNAQNGTPSQYVNSSSEDETYGVALPGSFVNNTPYPNSIFSTERYNTLLAPENMQWNIPLSQGTYTVNLLFAEVWTGAQSNGVRVFDVAIEGQVVLNDFDQTAVYGYANAGVESFVVEVNDGNLDIDFIKGIENPNIKGIEIISNAGEPIGDWTNITNVTEHTPRHENSFVQAGDKFYLFGGRENAKKVEIYDYNTNSWSQAASTAPFEFNHFQAVAYEGLIWVIGSFKDNEYPNEAPADHIYMYNPVSDTWIQGPAIPNARKRGSAGLVMYNSKFYVIAGNTIGHNGGYIPWFDEFDPATGKWTVLGDIPRARDHFHATVVGNKLYVVGGRLTGGDGGTFAPVIPEVDVYDFVSKTWITLPASSNLPTPRAASGTVTFNGKVVVIGGEGNGQAYVNTDALDINTNTWTSLSDLNNPRHGTQGIVSGDGIWITSGSPNQGGGSQTKMEVYGTDNPAGTAIVASTLAVPSNISVPQGGVEDLLISVSGGNQGVYVKSLALTGSNASNFKILGSNSFLIEAGTTRTIQIEHIGSQTGEEATLVMAYGSNGFSNIDIASGEEVSTILYRVNAGGGLIAATDAPNPDWSVDQGTFGIAGNSQYLAAATATNGLFDQSSGSAYAGPINMAHASLPSGTPSNMFTTERYDAEGAPEMLWQFPVDAGTEVEVRLYFAELYNQIIAAGQRVFDVSVEGSVPTTFNDIDPFAKAGALGAFMVSHRITVTDGTLDIQFIHGIENPSLKGIEILDVTGSPTSGLPPVVANPGGQIGVDGGTVNLQIIANDENTDTCGPLSYSATNLPPNLTIDPTTGIISGTILGGSGSGTAGAFMENNGLVIIEAETDFVDTAGGWNLETTSGTTYLVGGNDHFSGLNGQSINYNVEITTPGVYRFHVKSAISGSSSTDKNDTWFKIENTPDVHFFTVQGGDLTGTQQFLNELSNPASTTKTLYWPKGNSQGRSDHVTENPGINGFFKVYTNTIANSWYARTIDNNAWPIYAYFANPGTYAITMNERSEGHKIDRIALTHIDNTGTGVNNTLLNGAQSLQNEGGSPGASENSPYNVAVTVSDACEPSSSTVVNFNWNITALPIGNPEATVMVTPGTDIAASTFDNNSFFINNTGDDNIVNVTINTASGYMMDVVFDPVGTAGDSVAKCLTAGNAGSSSNAVGLTVPGNGGSDNEDCLSVFSQPHNGVNNAEGYDVLSLNFTDFNPGESFVFGIDMDPTTIKGDLSSGDAGSISGFELIGATITIEFASGVVYSTSLYDQGSFGGSDAIVNGESNSLVAPSILVEGSNASRVVAEANQVVQINGEPNAMVSLLRVDGRLYIDAGNPSIGYDIDPFEANEAMAKELYTIQLNASGVGNIPVTLTQTLGSGGTPNGGLNHFIAVVTGNNGINSVASNTIVLEYDPSTAESDMTISYSLQGRTDQSIGLTVGLYEVGATIPLMEFTPNGTANGEAIVDGIPQGTYEVAVKTGMHLQKVATITLEAGDNNLSIGELRVGDANNDNTVGLEDFSVLVTTFNIGFGNTGYDPRADFNGDGSVGLEDFSLLVTNFNVAGEVPSGL